MACRVLRFRVDGFRFRADGYRFRGKDTFFSIGGCLFSFLSVSFSDNFVFDNRCHGKLRHKPKGVRSY